MNWQKLFNSHLFLLAALGAVGLISYFLISELKDRYKVESDIADLKKQILSLEKNNNDLTGLVNYFKTTSFQEKELRLKLNLQKPGEHMVVLPGQQTEPGVEGVQSVSVKPMPNWQLWWKYFFVN